MLPLIIVVVFLFVFRILGIAGIGLFATWEASARFALALMFLFVASSHFTKTGEDLIRMVPKGFPNPRLIVQITGALELLGAIGLLLPFVSHLAAFCLILLLIAMFPANVNAALKKIPLRGKDPTPLWLRLPVQLILIGLLWWSTLL